MTPARFRAGGGADLSGREFERTAFVDVDMTEASNQGAVFTECSFRGVKFNASTHAHSAFLNCTFTRCTFFDATFTGCKLIGGMFDGGSSDLLKDAVIDPYQDVVIAGGHGHGGPLRLSRAPRPARIRAAAGFFALWS